MTLDFQDDSFRRFERQSLPSLLFVNFRPVEFIAALTSGIVCIIALSAAHIGYCTAPLGILTKIVLTSGALLLITTSWWRWRLAAQWRCSKPCTARAWPRRCQGDAILLKRPITLV